MKTDLEFLARVALAALVSLGLVLAVLSLSGV
jgi:hypothetical protein